MKKLCTLLLCAGMLLGAATGASAIDFKARGQWLMGFGLKDTRLTHETRDGDVKSKPTNETFFADQRVRLWLDAVASESLSGTVGFEIGTAAWGKYKAGAALGADQTVVKVKAAYIDWATPELPLKVRMGIQPVTMPNVAGGSAILDTDVAAITANYQITENLGLTAMWMRPLNDNYDDPDRPLHANYLDNIDLFALSLPLHFDGVEVTPWAMLGMKGANAMKGINSWNGNKDGFDTADGNLNYTLYPYPGISGRDEMGGTSKGYGSLFWAGLPIQVSMFDPLNIELDVNYGYAEPMGRYWAYNRFADISKRSSTKREGWLIKALVEYKMEWGVPGIFGWYASGDDGNVKNGSERMPSVVPMGNFTSFMGDGNFGWPYNDYALSYAGTWGIGLQVRDVSFIEELSHTFRVAYWGGTNSPSMVKYMDASYSWNDGWGSNASPYLTTEDGLLEFNLLTTYQMYENFNVNLELAYVANYMDNDTWKKAGSRDTSFQRQDAWKAGLIFEYQF